MNYAFHCCNTMSRIGIMQALSRLLDGQDPPVILCVGSDLAIGDSLGPVTGTLLKKKANGIGGYVYGTLKSSVTAKEINYVGDFLKKTHPKSKIIAVDAALGEESEIGLIKISNESLRPGSGANKQLGTIGDLSILGIVADKHNFSYETLNLTRLGLVYTMAETISAAVYDFWQKYLERKKQAM